MASISYVGDVELLGNAFLKRNYNQINKCIKEKKENLSCSVEHEGEIYGCEIRENIPLTQLYGFRVRVVDFVFSKIENLYNEEQDEQLEKLFQLLCERVKHEKAYYTFRIPTQIMGVLIKYNSFFKSAFLCGGIVTYITAKGAGKSNREEKTNIYIADDSYIKKYGNKLLRISAETFDNYQGQYHLSPVTSKKAGLIYKDWLKRSFSSNVEKIFVVTYKSNPVGFATVRETDTIVEAILGGISNEYRELGAYTNLIRNMVNYTNQKGKAFIIGTQFENLIVQGTWSHFGLKPFNSFYNFHLDAR